MTWVLLDCNFLVYRAHYAMPTLSVDGKATGATFGFLRDLRTFQDLWAPCRFVFAFDGGIAKRREILPGYKQKRKPATDEQKEIREAIYSQIKRLRTKILPRLGYRNILWTQDYEADDQIAAACKAIPDDDSAVIVSADQDMWQLITANVYCYNPITSRSVTFQSFYKKWGLDPSLWVHVKAAAGCRSDEIPGIKGVGELTAAAWYRGTLSSGDKAKKLEKQLDIQTRNLKLVRLPFPGTPWPEWHKDVANETRWRKVCKRLGLDYLIDFRGRKKDKKVRKASMGFGLGQGTME